MQFQTLSRSSRRVCGVAILAMVTFAATIHAQTFTDTFDGGANSAGWTFNSQSPDVIEPAGGNPGAWLHNSFLDTFAPILTSTFGVNSNFVGNYRTKGVTNIAIDARTDAATFGAGGRDFTLLLRNTRGTPDDFDDDDFAYFLGPLVPQVGQGWVHYDFGVPSQSTDAVPAGWRGGYSGDPENFRPGVTWNDIVTNVDRVEFWWLNPAFFAIFQTWDVGVDNVSITVPEPSMFTVASIGCALLMQRRRRI